MNFLEEAGKWVSVVLALCIGLIILLFLFKGLFGRFIKNKKIIDAPIDWFMLIGGISLASVAVIGIIYGAILIIKKIF